MFYHGMLCEFEASEVKDETATFTGVASTSDLDAQGDVIEPRAFEPINPKSILMLRDHDRTQVIGGWNYFAQEGKYLTVEGEILLAVQKGRETYSLMKGGFLSGLSVGFNIPNKSAIKQRSDGGRTISKALLVECSIVARPANKAARVINVKSILEDCGLDEISADIAARDGIEALLKRRIDEREAERHIRALIREMKACAR
jgi:HK97 family phage prohead protease